MTSHKIFIFTEIQKEGGTDIAMELWEAFLFREVSVPQPDYLVNRELSSQVATDPPVSEVHEVYLQVIQMLKGLYDGVINYASVVMIGTSQLTDALQKLSHSNKNGAPQFFRRIKAGIRVIPAHKDFKPFFQKFKIDDKGLRDLLTRLCNNYGELHDYLEPALREADEAGQPLTEQFFRVMYNLPKQ